MAKGVYVGISNVAKKVKKIYVSIGGVAKKVKKAYVGVGGVAKLFYSGDPEWSIKSISKLSQARYMMATTSIGDYGLFGGGRVGGSSSGISTIIDAYDTSLTRSLPINLLEAREGAAAISIGNYGLFGGGLRSTYLSSVEAISA